MPKIEGLIPTDRIRRLIDLAGQLGARELEAALIELVHIRTGHDDDESVFDVHGLPDPVRDKFSIMTRGAGAPFEIYIKNEFTADEVLHVAARLASFVRRQR